MAGAPAVSPVPGAPSYAQAATLANNAYNNALAQINRNRLNTLTQYGYKGTVDPTTGVISDVGVDPMALHGQLQDLLHSQALEDMHADLGAQDRGLVGGLAHQAASELHFQHGSQDAQLGTALTGQLSDFQDQQQQAGEARDAALWQAEQSALDSTLSGQGNDTLDQLLNPGGDYSTGGSGGSGGSTGSGAPGTPAPTRSVRGVDMGSVRRLPQFQAKHQAQKKILNRPRRPGRQDQ